MLLRFAGSLIILISAAFLGFVFSRDSARRPVQLRALQGSLQMLENEIGFMSNVLTASFERISSCSKSETAAFFLETAEALKISSGLNASEAWDQAVSDNIGKTALNAEDKGVLISFGKMLGGSDTEGQIANIRLTLSQLKLQEKKAEEAKAKNASMYKSLGILGGVALVIILI